MDGKYDFYTAVSDAWLFSFDKKSKLKVRPDKKDYAIRHRNHCLNYFG